MTGTAPGRGLAEAPRTLAFTVVISGYALGGLAAWAVIAALLWLLWRWAALRVRKRDAEETGATPE